MHSVITFSGEGPEEALTVLVRVFTSQTAAKKFIADNTVRGKFWRYFEMLTDGYEYSTHHEDLFD